MKMGLDHLEIAFSPIFFTCQAQKESIFFFTFSLVDDRTTVLKTSHTFAQMLSFITLSSVLFTLTFRELRRNEENVPTPTELCEIFILKPNK